MITVLVLNQSVGNGQANFSSYHTHTQDMVMFNDSILYNIAYGDLSATQEQVRGSQQVPCCCWVMSVDH